MFSVRTPAGMQARIGLRNGEGLAVSDTLISDAQGRTRVFSADRLPAQNDAPVSRAEAWYATVYASPSLEDGHAPGWSAAGDHYLQMTAPFLKTDTAAAALARRLAPDTSDARRTVESLFAHMRENFRYHADLRGVHGYIPRPAGQSVKEGWGDCKALSTVFMTMARARGVTARLALIATRSQAQPSEEYPTLGNYNHMIVAWKDGDAWRFVDPTCNYGDAASSAYWLLGRTALLLDSGASRLVTVTPGPEWRNDVTTRSEIVPDGQGWRLQGTLTLEGGEAHEMFPMLHDLKGEETGPVLASWLREEFGFQNVRAALRSLDWRRIEIHYSVPYDRGYLALDQGGWAVEEPRLLGASHALPLGSEGPIEYRAFTQTDTWKLPPGFTDYEEKTLESPFAKGRWSRDSAGLHRAYRQEDRLLFPADSTERRRFLTEQRNFMREIVWKP
jgi:hypothetical protein